MVENNVSQIGFESEISMSPFWSAIRHASVRRRRRLHAVKTFKVGGHHFASLSDKLKQTRVLELVIVAKIEKLAVMMKFIYKFICLILKFIG